MRFRWATLTLCASQLWGCENPQPTLVGVTPEHAYNDGNVRLTLVGSGFVPAAILDPGSGRRIAVIDGFHARIGKGSTWAELTALDWQSTGQLAATFTSASAALLPPGDLDVEIEDPRGQETTLTNAFYELGPDLEPPTVEFTSPSVDTPVGAGTVLQGRFHALDALPGSLSSLGWTYFEADVVLARSNCQLALPTDEADCTFTITTSKNLRGGEEIRIVAEAFDASATHNRGAAARSFTVLAQPLVQTISPPSGGTAGGTDVVITGTGFLPGSQVFVDGALLFPDGGIVLDGQTQISGHVPAHEEGKASITVRTPIGDAAGPPVYFQYLPPPSVEDVMPKVGAAAGGTGVSITGKNFGAGTRIYFGLTLDSAVPLADQFLQSDTMIVGHAPKGEGQTTVWAVDDVLGFTRLPNGFAWRSP